MSDGVDHKHELGFSLVECLIATAIASGVVVAVVQSISASQRLARETLMRSQMLEEAEAIVARLRAGQGKEAALEGMQDWQISFEPPSFAQDSEPAYFERAVVTSRGEGRFSVEIAVPLNRNGRQ